jgi:tetratricopeptide (TPR) repeat protein
MSYAYPSQRLGNFSTALQYLDYGDIQGFDSAGARLGKIRASDRLLRLAWAPRRAGILPGVNLKVAQEELDNVTATAFALDMGLLYRLPLDYDASSFFKKQLSRTSFGLAMSHLGPKVKFEERSEELPLTFRLGMAYRSFADALTIALDLERFMGRSEALTLHSGVEAWLKDILALRLGLRSDQDIGPGISAGLGFKFGAIQVDYAFTPFGDLGDVHRMGVSLRFGRSLLERYYEQGLYQMRLGNYAEAVLLFDKALAINPKDQRVLSKALEAGQALHSLQEHERPSAKP